jgi:glycosyltransferase involved in cell wall biosynthesis
MSTRAKLSVIVTTFNEQRHIGECLEALQWCDDVLVVDSFSTDRTVEIARSYGNVRVIQRPYYGGASQKNWAMNQVSGEWILIFDSDERCTPALRAEIEQVLTAPTHEAYAIRRLCYFLGKPIRYSGWKNDKVVRLLRRGTGCYQNRRVHAQLVTRSPAKLLKNPMLHYMTETLDEYIQCVVRYSWWGAAQAWREGRRTGVPEILVRSLYRFFRTYVLQLGFLDGARGLVFCMLQAMGCYVKWSMLWSWHVNMKRGIAPDLPVFDEDPETWRGLEPIESARADAELADPAHTR